MGKRKIGRLLAAILAVGITSLSFGQASDPISVKLLDPWQAQHGSPVISPIRVAVTNTGKPEVGLITYRNDSLSYVTPIELPSGTTKIVEFAHFSFGSYDPRIFVQVGAYVKEFSVPLFTTDTQSKSWAVISDRPNEIGFFNELRKFNDDKKPWTKVAPLQAAAEEAPNRAVYYAALDALILGVGSERLSDEVTAAIQAGMVQGTKVIIPGGTESPILRDPRWRDFLPASVTGTANVDAGSMKLIRENSGPAGTATILNLRPKLGSKSFGTEARPEAVMRGVGKGAIIQLAFDPFENPFRTWSGRGKMLFSLELTPPPKQDPGQIQYGRQTPVQFYFQGGVGNYSEGTLVFPPAARIAALLILFAILAVPVNFLVLRRLGKGELAWITAPIISLLFAGFVLSGTGELYQRPASRSTFGIVRGFDGVGMTFDGRQQFFIPRGGQHDLKLANIESIASPPDSDEYFRSGFEPRRQNDTFVEMGSLVAPQFASPSLSFREFVLFQRLPALPPMSRVKAERVGNEVRLVGTVINTTGSKILAAEVFAGNKSMSKPTDLAPGEFLEVKGSIDLKAYETYPAVLRGSIEPDALGSQYGQDESLENTVTLELGLRIQEGS